MAGSDEIASPATAKAAILDISEKVPNTADPEKKDSGTTANNDQAESTEVKSKKITVGMVCEKKDLYQKIDKHNRATWTAEIPDDLDEAAENEETEKYALLIRNRKSYDSRKKLEIDSIVIQSPLLKTVLRSVLKDYPGVTATLSRLIFSAPFKPFVHRWYQLTKALDGEHDGDTKTHLKLLHNVLYSELKDVIAATEDYVKNKVVTYEQIWTIFQPGCLVYATRLSKPVAVRLIDGQFIQHQRLGPCFQLKCDRVDWDGSRFGYDVSPHFIMPFEGTTPITELDCFPLAYHSDEKGTIERLIARGRQFEAFAGFHYKAYRGRAIETTRYGPSMTTVEGRIVIDASAHKKANPNQQLYLKPLDRLSPIVNVQAEDSDDEWSDYVSEYDDGDLEIDDALPRNRRPLTEEQLLLCTPILRGYALRTKLWLEFFIDSVREIVFNDNAFKSLVLPEGHKSLILAIAQAQLKNKDIFDDVIVGKGRGIIMLLSGGPGIGKTLTAESVAEHMRAPLYMMSAGDLGTNSSEVEAGLTRVLDMVAKWNAVLLLDECDVFLEARSTHDLDRNRIVSIFLRTLEYYEGILFLTTNRVKHMDEAFHSRIHFRLAYPNLDEKARSLVWKGFLDRQQGGHNVSHEDLEKLAKIDINGRVIKNVLKSATLLASHKEEKLDFKHLETVLQVDQYEIQN
ncbi:P-loop containing nucleoside triphosphate hydrolase protein [Xylariaceae sp. FL1651]|nr:P-loop containing nucleoside triphosphate hydrolase protein [Xylariaceae sp. FL1651]